MRFFKMNDVDTCVVVPDGFFSGDLPKEKQLYLWYVTTFRIENGLQAIEDIKELSPSQTFWEQIQIYDLFTKEKDGYVMKVKKYANELYIQRKISCLIPVAEKIFKQNGNAPWCAISSLTFC